MGILKFVCLRPHSVRNYNTSILTSLVALQSALICICQVIDQIWRFAAAIASMTGAYDKVWDLFVGQRESNHDSPSPDDVHNRTPQFLFLFEIQNSSKINFACMHLTWSPSYFLLDKRDMSISDYDLEWGAPCDTLCLNWSQAVCLLSVGGLAAGKQERRTCGQPVDQILWNVTQKKPCWKVKRGEMDFSQYFWSVPSRLDELSGGIQRQETFLETFLVNSLQVEIQKLNSCQKNMIEVGTRAPPDPECGVELYNFM